MKLRVVASLSLQMVARFNICNVHSVAKLGMATGHAMQIYNCQGQLRQW